MSALAKPFVVPTAHATLVSGPPIPAEEVSGFTPGVRSGKPGETSGYTIDFTMKTVDHKIVYQSWVYKKTAAGLAERNTRLAALQTALSATV